MRKLIVFTLLISIMTQACKNNADSSSATATDSTSAVSAITKVPFGKLPDGQEVNLYTLKNKNGIEMQVINYGAIITSLKAPDKNGVFEDIVLGYDSLDQYLKATPYFGAIVGRYGNRIANGKFSIDGTAYTLAQNNNGQHLHGGEIGFDKVFWNIEEYSSTEGPALKLSYLSKDGEEGYPGNLQSEVLYILTDNNELKIDYKATTDKKTVVNLTQHTYFNLTGNCKRDILDHQLVLASDKFVPVDKVLIPMKDLKDVTGTPFDFRTATAIGARINEKDAQLEAGLGYDHCWVLSSADSLKFAGSIYEPGTGRFVEVLTSEPAIQFYCGNFLDGTLTGKGGVVYKHRYGLCLETEHFPDSPNRPDFPTTLLNPGEVYKTQTIYRFSTK